MTKNVTKSQKRDLFNTYFIAILVIMLCVMSYNFAVGNTLAADIAPDLKKIYAKNHR